MNSSSKPGFTAAIEKTHGQQLRRFLSARMRNAVADVPDMVQEVFLRLLRVKNPDAIRNPQAYLYTVAAHVLHQHNLQKSTRPETLDPLEDVAEFQVSTAPDPADELDVEQRLAEVGRDLERLSPRVYATLIMYRCEGLTLHEIGHRLGVSHVMARKYLTRAIAYCDRRLEEREQS